MSQYKIQEIASFINCKAVIKQDATIEHLVIDTRKITWQKSSLFFAIKTSTNNGHQYIEVAYKSGIFNFVVEENIDTTLYPNANFLIVNNTVTALQELAQYHRKQFNIPVIGITGSNGKTIVKEWLFQLLQHEFSIVRSPKSYNSQIGVPLSLWQIQSHHNLAIIEVGISQTQEMEKLQGIIQPTIGVFTHFGDAHSNGFNNDEEKLQEKWKLFKQSKTIIANISSKLKDIVANSNYTNCNINAFTIQKQQYQTVINAELNHKSFAFNIPFIDDASIQNCFTCCVAMVFLDYSNEIINERIKQLSHLHMRLQLQNAINNCVIVNDTYTNDFTAFISGVDFLQQNKGVKKSTIILSDFIESSFNKDQLYSQLTSILQANAIDTFIGIGNQMVANNHSLQQACKEVFLFENVDEFLKSKLHQQFKNQIIYIKGARVFGLEKIVNQLQQKNHQTQLQINLNALQHNLKVIKQTIAPTTQIMGMVKAFGYGSGSEEVAKLLQFNNLDYLAVAYTDEGIALRKSGISLPIMVMNIDADNFYDLVEYNLEPEIFSFSLLHQFIQFLNQQGLHQYPIHVKVNTGMNRLGFEVIDSEQIGITLSSSTLVKIKSVFTHLASSDDSTHDDYTLYQQHQFDEFCNTLKQQINYTFLQHAANTAAIIRHPQLQYNMVRLGIGLYGIQNTNNSLPLQTVATLTSTIAQIRKVKKGESVGYNRKTILNSDSLIATIRIGYADGLSRQLSNGKGSVWIHNQLAPIVGNVCMDMTMIDVTQIPEAKEGDTVEIFGQHLSINQIAAWSNTIAYETISTINQRVKRVYIQE